MITVTIRDINGKRKEISEQTHGLMHHTLIEALNDSTITGEDEILMVTQDHMCLYSALGNDHPIAIDEVIAFFA